MKFFFEGFHLDKHIASLTASGWHIIHVYVTLRVYIWLCCLYFPEIKPTTFQFHICTWIWYRYVTAYVLLTYHSISNVRGYQSFTHVHGLINQQWPVGWWSRNEWKNAPEVTNRKQKFEMFYTEEITSPCNFYYMSSHQWLTHEYFKIREFLSNL